MPGQSILNPAAPRRSLTKAHFHLGSIEQPFDKRREPRPFRSFLLGKQCIAAGAFGEGEPGEAEPHVPLGSREDDASEEAEDLAGFSMRGHPVPDFRGGGWRTTAFRPFFPAYSTTSFH